MNQAEKTPYETILDLSRSEPLVYNWLTRYIRHDVTWEDALMGLVIDLVSVNAKQRAKLAELAASSSIPTHPAPT